MDINMNSLIRYEYKKLLQRKSTWIAMIFAILITLFSCYGDLMGNVYVEGKPVYTHYEQMLTDRTYARELSGKALDEVLIGEMQAAYLKVPDVPLYSATVEYQTYARPYSEIYHYVRTIAEAIQEQEGKEIDLLGLDGSEYYELRNQATISALEDKNLSEAELEQHILMNRQVTTPFVFQYTDGYRSIMSRMYTIGIILILTLTVCLAPIFANEFADHTDQLILTSRYGKNKAILAKLITGMSFGLILTVIILLTQMLPTLLVYGFDGWNAPIQLLNVMSTYPLTVLQGTLILCGMAVIASLLMVSFSLFLSTKLKSAFAVIVVISTCTILTMFIRIPEDYRILYQLVNALPMNITNQTGSFSDYFYVLFQNCFTTYQVVPILYVLIIILLHISSYRSFKNHQIQ